MMKVGIRIIMLIVTIIKVMIINNLIDTYSV